MSKVLIGLNTYNDLPLLKECLPVLEEMRVNLPADVVLLDTAWNNEVQAYVEQDFPKFTYLRHPDGNIGYGKSYNEILKQRPGYGIYLVVTSDVLLHAPTVKDFVQRMQKDTSIAMCSGKIHHWDIKNHRKTEQIDSLGIAAQKRHHFYDRGHGEMDHGQYDDSLQDILGLTGAVFLIRTAVIPKLHGDASTLFEEKMWMYKEDIDLAYRLRWLGEKIVLFPEVWAWHGRSVANKEGHSTLALSKADKSKRDYGRMHSYKNHFVLLKNNFTWRYGFWVLLQVLFYEFSKATYMFFRYPKVFFAGLKTLLFVRGRRSSRRVSPQEILSHFE